MIYFAGGARLPGHCPNLVIVRDQKGGVPADPCPMRNKAGLGRLQGAQARLFPSFFPTDR
jgi:hypothetical protein